MHLNHVGGGEDGLSKHRLLNLTPRLSDSAVLGGAQEFACPTSSQVLLWSREHTLKITDLEDCWRVG